MQRRSATTRLIVDASLVIQETVGVLSDPECGAAMRASGTAARSVALCRTITANSRSELAIAPSLFVEYTRLEMMYSGQVWRHTKSCPEREGSSHTTPAPRPEASQNPRLMGLHQTISTRYVGQAAVWYVSVRQSEILQWNSGTATPDPPRPGLAHTRYGRYVLPIQALLSAWSGASQPRARYLS